MAVVALTGGCTELSGEIVAGPAAAADAIDDATVPSGGCGTVVDRPSSERVHLHAGGVVRWYDLFVPSDHDGGPIPLVVDLHGYVSGAEGQAALSGLRATAEEAGFAVATPQGNSDLAYWNAAPSPALPDDVGFVAAVIADAGARRCIDPTRVFVDGFSNGAFLASLVACRLADRVAAVAAVAGLMLPEECRPARPIPVLAIHGTDDHYVAVDGGPGAALADLDWNKESRAAFEALPFGDVEETAAGWARLVGCRAEPERTAIAQHVEVTRYDRCAGGAEVALYVVDGGGHTWPGSAFTRASEQLLGTTTDAVDANELIWSFFEEHPMPPLQPSLPGPGGPPPAQAGVWQTASTVFPSGPRPNAP